MAQPCQTFRSPPPFLRGPLRRALHFALDQILHTPAAETEHGNFKFSCPACCSTSRAGPSKIPKAQLLSRFTAFFSGHWGQLLQACHANQPCPQQLPETTTAPQGPSSNQRAQLAAQLTRLGELSRARQALLADPLAPGNATTLEQFTDPAARPLQPYQPIHSNILTWAPQSPCHLPSTLLTTNLRRARRGTAPGPNGLTARLPKSCWTSQQQSQLS